jgi:glycosyltransferase involved in cell wall biosynthesis
MIIFIFSKSCWNIYNFRKNLIKKLIASKYKIYILSVKDTYQKKLESLGCQCINIKFNNRGLNLIQDLLLLFRIFFLIKKYKPKVLLNFNIKPVLYGSLVAKFFKIKCINTITGLGTAFLQNKLINLIFIFIYRTCLSPMNIIVFHNKDDKNFFLENKIISKKQAIVVAGSGVDFSYFRYKKFIGNNKKFLFIGRLLWSKGIGEFISAANFFFHKHSNLRFNVIGDFAENAMSGIDKPNHKKFFQNKNIKYLGVRENIRKYIAINSCVVLMSHREGLPKALIEAAAIGRPIISSNVVGSREVVVNNYNGFLCKVNSSRSLISAISKFSNLSNLKRMQMGKNSRLLAEKKFNESCVIDKYLKMLNIK